VEDLLEVSVGVVLWGGLPEEGLERGGHKRVCKKQEEHAIQNHA
jgi:hypothetical protein